MNYDKLTKEQLLEIHKDTLEYLNEQEQEIERLKEEYIILQNASDEVEEEKDKEIERLNNIIYKARKMIFDNYGLLDKYEVEILDDILEGVDRLL